MKLSFKITVILVVCFFSCKKPPESETKGPNCIAQPVKYISAEISNFKFKKGTYWVFIDSISLNIDTLRVDTVLSNGLSPYQYCPNNFHEYYSFQVNQKTNSNYDYYLLDETALKINPLSETAIGIYYTNTPKIDSIFIYDRYYKSVVTNNNIRTGSNTIFYMNTTFGFLKKEVYANSQLVSKKLLKDKFIIR